MDIQSTVQASDMDHDQEAAEYIAKVIVVETREKERRTNSS